MTLERNTTILRADFDHEMREAKRKIDESNFSTCQKRRFKQILDDMDKKLVVYQGNRFER